MAELNFTGKGNTRIALDERGRPAYRLVKEKGKYGAQGWAVKDYYGGDRCRDDFASIAEAKQAAQGLYALDAYASHAGLRMWLADELLMVASNPDDAAAVVAWGRLWK